MRFSYELIVGTCRAGLSASGGLKSAGANSISRVMKVPIRVYNNVAGKCLQPVGDVNGLADMPPGSWQIAENV
jgi:RAB6A-GEF complex partner protein 2